MRKWAFAAPFVLAHRAYIREYSVSKCDLIDSINRNLQVCSVPCYHMAGKNTRTVTAVQTGLVRLSAVFCPHVSLPGGNYGFILCGFLKKV